MAEAVTSLRDELTSLFTGSLAHCADTLRLEGDGPGSLSASELLRPAVLEDVIGRFGAAYDGADRRAVLSLWFQWYFGTLLVPTTAILLALRRALPLRLDQVGIHMDHERHHVVAVRLEDVGRTMPDAGPFELFHDVVWNHLDPLICATARTGGLSERLLWNTAGGYVEWTVRQLEARAQHAEAAGLGRLLLQHRCWPGDQPNPLFRPVCYVRQGENRVRRRRVCCLRYMLPGEAGCGSLCPLPKVQEAAS